MAEGSNAARADSEWARRQKWEDFYSGTYAPHLRGATEPDTVSDGAIEALPWRSMGATPQLVDFLAAAPNIAASVAVEIAASEEAVGIAPAQRGGDGDGYDEKDEAEVEATLAAPSLQLPWSDARCCELGCGTGENLVFLSGRCAAVVGMDIVPAAVEASKRSLVGAGNAEVFCVDALEAFGGDEDGADLGGGTGGAEGAGEAGRGEMDAAAGSAAAGSAAADAFAGAADALAGAAAEHHPGVLARAATSTSCDQRVREVGGPFDFIIDVQTFHVLVKIDARAAALAYRRLLRPGGVLLMLTGNAEEEAERGPERMTQEGVLSAFDGTGLVCVSLRRFRFEWTETYRRQPFDEPPLGWQSVWRCE